MALSATVTLKAPGSIVSGHPITVVASVTNTGKERLDPTLKDRLGFTAPENDTAWGPPNRAELPGPLDPGGSVDVTVQAVAPAGILKAELRTLTLRMLREGVLWYGTPGAVAIEVQPAPPPPPPGCDLKIPAPGLQPGALRPFHLLNTGPLPADGVAKLWRWDNPSLTETLRLLLVRLWIGVGLGGRVDCQTILTRASDGAPIATMAYDRYSDPSQPSDTDHDFGVGWIEIPPGDGILIVTSGSVVGGGATSTHHRAELFFLS